LIVVDEIFDNRRERPDKLDFIKENVGLPGEINTQDFERRLDLFYEWINYLSNIN